MSYAHTQVAQIVAISNNRCIGKDNQLPWHISEDLQHFKRLTTTTNDNTDSTSPQGIVIMGRKTFESMNSRPLPNRVNFIITTQLDYAEKHQLNNNENVQVVHNLDDALTQATTLAHGCHLDTIWVIGGEKVFQGAMLFTDRLEITLVDTNIENGDAFYPQIPDEFQIVSQSEQKVDEKSGLGYQFVRYERV
ncbi:dihydrofolate reductase [Psychrobacter sp. I-STPA6b]|uniref:dihydrofolate reductase n=1 Tax=Psychrobacter sp. I-STPA6b TaxID=2585718 RepID=UPI001D0CA857|nr:dihydrofolate reductase [Psychrobacter sp. I-STPA6b]